MKNDEESKRILFAGGGTAGHLMPAINIAKEMISQDPAIKPLFIGRKNGMEKKIVNRFGFDIEEIDAIGMKRTAVGVLRFILKWKSSINQAYKILNDFRPAAVVGTGGYISAHIVKAAHKMKILIFLQEQNSLPGLASRGLGRYAEKIFIAYESANKYFNSEKCILAGNPINTDINDANLENSYREFSLDDRKKTLLVLGGSSGAKGINSAISKLVKGGHLPHNWQILWQTGKGEFEDIKSTFTNNNFNGIIRDFIDNMPGAYKTADLVVSRAGAMAISEITAVGLPSVLIPYPHATGDHQTLNANALVENNAAILVQEKEIENRFVNEIVRLFDDTDRLNELAVNSERLSKPDAAGIIARTILKRLNEI